MGAAPAPAKAPALAAAPPSGHAPSLAAPPTDKPPPAATPPSDKAPPSTATPPSDKAPPSTATPPSDKAPAAIAAPTNKAPAGAGASPTGHGPTEAGAPLSGPAGGPGVTAASAADPSPADGGETRREPGAAAPAGERREEERRAADKRLDEAQARREAPLDPKARADALRGTALPSVAGRPVRGYAQRGILELGGSVSFVNATGFTELGIAPTAGWFFIDNVALSLIPQINYVKAAGEPARVRTVVLLEPGFHMQMSGPLFAFFGAGAGVAYEKESGVGLAISPRAGLKVLIGGSGVLTAVFEYVYAANERAETPTADDPNSATYGVRAGYSVAW